MSPAIHALKSGLHNVGDLVGVGGVIRDDCVVGRCQQRRVTIGVLKAFTGQGGATRGGAHDEAPRHLVTGSPHGIARALETKHRIEDIDRNHRFAKGGVAGTDRREGSKGSSLVDSGVQNLALGAFLVSQEQLAVDRCVSLAVRVIDLGGREVGIHSKGSSLIRNDRDQAVAKVLVLQEVFKQPGKGHGARNLLLARALSGWFIDRAIGKGHLRVPRTALWQVATESPAALVEILNCFVLVTRVVVGGLIHICFERGVRDRNAHVVTEGLQVL